MNNITIDIKNILNLYIESGIKLSTKLTISFWKKNYDIDKIYEYANINELSYDKFSELIYLIYNDLQEKPKCYCGNKIFKYKNFNNGYNKHCSIKCRANDKDIMKVRLNTYKNTCIEKYGVDNVSKLDDVKLKKENTMLENFGYKYNSQRPEIKEKLSEYIKSEDRQNKIQETFLKKYNRISPVSDEITKKRINTCNDNKISRINEYGKSHNFVVNELIDNYTFDCNCTSCETDFEIKYQLLHLRMNRNETVCTNCNLVFKPSSVGENEVYEFIKNNYNDNIILRDRSLGIELDIYLPDLNLAIEFNGVYWHSELHKSNDYHINKTNICNDNNINLVHIWQDDWIYKQDIIKSIILNKLGKSKRIYARKCVIKEITYNECKEFLINNHIQGDSISQYRYGLYHLGELVSVMTFGKRNSIIELLRFCNKLEHTVVGGASRLFKRFIKDHEPLEILTYADLSFSIGNLYYNLGFEYIKNTKPNYWWIVDGIKSHRLNWQKKTLIKNGLLIEGETENECMYRLGYYRVFDCGSMIFKYKFNI